MHGDFMGALRIGALPIGAHWCIAHRCPSVPIGALPIAADALPMGPNAMAIAAVFCLGASILVANAWPIGAR